VRYRRTDRLTGVRVDALIYATHLGIVIIFARPGPDTGAVTDLVPGRLPTTRRAWHGVAELVLAGPQDRKSHTIRLRVTPGGFATIKDPALVVSHGDLVLGEVRVPLSGTTCAAIGALIGESAGAPVDRYEGGSGVDPDEVLELDPDALSVLAQGFDHGDAALRAFAPDQVPVLWPEHFDVGISVAADEVNYGVSPGDSAVDEPYAYVGPWQPRTGPFWNQPFGAARPLTELPTVDAIVAFFEDGRALLGP
jgi:hypothetical protein